jgi:hypothetical protein
MSGFVPQPDLRLNPIYVARLRRCVLDLAVRVEVDDAGAGG